MAEKYINKAEIVRGIRTYAAQCRACGQMTTAGWLSQAADWIEVQQATITAQKMEIAEMKKAAKRIRALAGKGDRDE